MQKQTLKQFGQKMREKLPLLEDLPQPIRKALEKLAEAEKRCSSGSSNAIGDN